MITHVLVYLLIRLLLLSSLSKGDDLDVALAKVAGIYIDPNKQSGYEKSVFVTACNLGYLNHLHNLKCFMDKLRYKFLVISMETQVHEYITQKTQMVSYLMNAGKFGEAAGTSAGFRDKHFNLITAKKIESVYEILRRGYDVIFSDLDVALLDDFVSLLHLPGVDYVHSVNAVCEK